MKLSGNARILKKRTLGKITFATARFKELIVQLVFKKNSTENYEDIKKIPIGSLIYISTTSTKTKQDMSSLLVLEFYIVHKVTTLLPDKYNGLTDMKRYSDIRTIDFIINDATFQFVTFMSQVTIGLRIALTEMGFHEFNTGILQRYFEGGYAKPFTVIGNASGYEYSLSLTSELKLKRLIIAGFEKVFEITQSFRNEGMDSIHSPEFTLLELYNVNQSVYEISILLENILKSSMFLAKMKLEKILPEKVIIMIDELQEEYVRIPFSNLFEKALQHEIKPTLISLTEHYPDIFNLEMTTATWVIKVIEKFIIPLITKPCFITEIPSGVSPFVKNEKESPNISKRYFFAMNQLLIADLYEDETNSEIIYNAMINQSNETGLPLNQSYLKALEFGIPQTSGIGIGLNRLYMAFLTAFELPKHIKETLLFPF